MITITAIGELAEGKKSVQVTLSDNRRAYLGARNIGTLKVGDDESKFQLKEKAGENGNPGCWFIDPAGGGFKGGGGGFKGAPKDEMSIVAQTIVKEAVETARQEAARKNTELMPDRLTTLAAQLTETYKATYAKLKMGADGC